jgi:hypothetical protein
MCVCIYTTAQRNSEQSPKGILFKTNTEYILGTRQYFRKLFLQTVTLLHANMQINSLLA